MRLHMQLMSMLAGLVVAGIAAYFGYTTTAHTGSTLEGTIASANVLMASTLTVLCGLLPLNRRRPFKELEARVARLEAERGSHRPSAD